DYYCSAWDTSLNTLF
nr:immunoglobulin light chain junction region [Macaca mulatta]MOW16562.1 immunoglobulin light chain junction region [Macaca mulatta]MOW17241.1 immunoglobulin light chain junction region [Macaca mulatta]MOW17430.1 immunoglobulin light chain junction region [Macaca mulatta]MOW17433.1 immunoglobulin light chain junction region [Macaca mulatta]